LNFLFSSILYPSITTVSLNNSIVSSLCTAFIADSNDVYLLSLIWATSVGVTKVYFSLLSSYSWFNSEFSSISFIAPLIAFSFGAVIVPSYIYRLVAITPK